MTEEPEVPMLDPEPTPEELEAIGSLSSSQVAFIDARLLSNASKQWRKVAFIVASALHQLPEEFDEIPDTFLAQRVRHLVESGFLQSQGNLLHMRFSEVRLRDVE